VLGARPFFAGGRRIEPGQMVRLNPTDAIEAVGTGRATWASEQDRTAATVAARSEYTRMSQESFTKRPSWGKTW